MSSKQIHENVQPIGSSMCMSGISTTNRSIHVYEWHFYNQCKLRYHPLSINVTLFLYNKPKRTPTVGFTWRIKSTIHLKDGTWMVVWCQRNASFIACQSKPFGMSHIYSWTGKRTEYVKVEMYSLWNDRRTVNIHDAVFINLL